MFRHYLITRFNLRNPKWDKTKNNESLLDEQWMEHRMELFANFCCPSVAAQTQTNFTWLVCFDRTTAQKYRDRASELLSGIPQARILYLDGMPAFAPAVRQLIESETKDIPYLITSRIDNDDCIHRDFIGAIQSHFKRQDYRAIDIVKGYSLQVSPEFMLGKKEHIFNPFISLIEKNDNPATVWQSDHNMWKKESRITTVSNKRLWMSIIHEKNKVNEFDGYGDVSWEELQRDFVVSDSMRNTIEQNLRPEKDWKWLSLKNAAYVKWVLFNKQFKRRLGIYKLKN